MHATAADRSLPWRVVAMLFMVTLPLAAENQPTPASPTLPSPAELKTRKDAIYKELDANVEAVRTCFEALDATDQNDEELRKFMDEQIERFDDRTNVLHQELAQIERWEFLTEHEQTLREQVDKLQTEARQLRARGHDAPAKLREAKAQSIQKTLDDGSWILLADDTRKPFESQADLVSVLQLNIEVENLKKETAKLRRELETLRGTVERLERLLKDSK